LATNEDDDEDNMEEDDDDETGRTTPYEAGQIMKVYVENFMCHRKFHIDLGRHLNFISGRNGSGINTFPVLLWAWHFFDVGNFKFR